MYSQTVYLGLMLLFASSVAFQPIPNHRKPVVNECRKKLNLLTKIQASNLNEEEKPTQLTKKTVSNEKTKDSLHNRVPLNSLATGQPLIGAVVDVTNFGAFIDCMCCRTGKGGAPVRALGLLHKSDIDDQHVLPGQLSKENKGAAVIKKGDHIKVYVKGVFPQAGRFTVTMDAKVDKAKLAQERERNKKVQLLRRRVRELKDVEVGQTILGEVKSVKDSGVFIDIGAQCSAFLSKESIQAVAASSQTEQLGEIIKPGDKVKVNVLDKEEHLIKLKLLEMSSSTLEH